TNKSKIRIKIRIRKRIKSRIKSKIKTSRGAGSDPLLSLIFLLILFLILILTLILLSLNRCPADCETTTAAFRGPVPQAGQGMARRNDVLCPCEGQKLLPTPTLLFCHVGPLDVQDETDIFLLESAFQLLSAAPELEVHLLPIERYHRIER